MASGLHQQPCGEEYYRTAPTHATRSNKPQEPSPSKKRSKWTFQDQWYVINGGSCCNKSIKKEKEKPTNIKTLPSPLIGCLIGLHPTRKG
jgi:hypothetical protein